MKRILAAAVGLSGILAACGSAGIAPDGSGSGRVIGVSTEYATDGQMAFVGCDEITNPSTVSRARSTQVIVKFATGGTITSVKVAVKGDKTNVYNQEVTLQASDLKKDSNGDYKAIFDFNSATGKFLPNSIVVSPNELPVKKVNASDRVEGGFYADLTINTSTGSSFTITSKNLGLTPVYRKCTLASTAQPLSQ
ncbi:MULTISPECIES: hypothetical protein [unclassified Deinococcus]|uniref:hypothetical protein n=1 Tax=unclassified Deinococcus TaxID=2623546 RepID=UPI0006DBE5DB|nr:MULTISPECIES: hypothetical protein [unclassified Deinococcus]MCD0156888.1 hypothetical protein [Deinococcus sp. 6GRE01]